MPCAQCCLACKNHSPLVIPAMQIFELRHPRYVERTTFPVNPFLLLLLCFFISFFLSIDISTALQMARPLYSGIQQRT
jgi:hypothetical protein